MEKKGFFGSLFDLSFTEFVTTRIVSVLYVLSIIGSAILGIVIISKGLASHSGTAGVLSLILGPLVFLLWILLARICLEVIIVVFRIAENTGRLVQHAEGQAHESQDYPSGPQTPASQT